MCGGVVVVRTLCFLCDVSVHATQRMHQMRVAEHGGVETPGVPATTPPPWRWSPGHCAVAPVSDLRSPGRGQPWPTARGLAEATKKKEKLKQDALVVVVRTTLEHTSVCPSMCTVAPNSGVEVTDTPQKIRLLRPVSQEALPAKGGHGSDARSEAKEPP